MSGRPRKPKMTVESFLDSLSPSAREVWELHLRIHRAKEALFEATHTWRGKNRRQVAKIRDRTQ